MRKRETATDDGGFTAGPLPSVRITPADVQQKEFRVARFGGGYRMREVDEFLDQVTDALSALLGELEELRAGRTPSTSIAPSVGGVADRSAVDAFLRREKGFLQDLGGLVQGHAEELKEMVRAARRDAAAATPPEAAEAAAAPPIAADEAVAVTPVVVTDAAAAGEPREEPEPGAAAEQVAAEESGGGDHAGTTSEATDRPAGEPDAPIRLEEPEPARSRRSDEDPDGSLRELFWGEE